MGRMRRTLLSIATISSIFVVSAIVLPKIANAEECVVSCARITATCTACEGGVYNSRAGTCTTTGTVAECTARSGELRAGGARSGSYSCSCTLYPNSDPGSAALDPVDGGNVSASSDADAIAACRTNCSSIAPARGAVARDDSANVTCTASCPTPPPSPPATPDTGAVVGEGGQRGAAAPTLPNPLGGTTDIRSIIGRVINAALGISGSIALLMFVWGGMLWLTSGGSPERIKKGKDAIVWAVLGLVLIFGSYAILNFVLGAILSA